MAVGACPDWARDEIRLRKVGTWGPVLERDSRKRAKVTWRVLGVPPWSPYPVDSVSITMAQTDGAAGWQSGTPGFSVNFVHQHQETMESQSMQISTQIATLVKALVTTRSFPK